MGSMLTDQVDLSVNLWTEEARASAMSGQTSVSAANREPV